MPLDEITCQINRVIWRAPNSRFSILAIRIGERDETALGDIADPVPGETLCCWGSWEDDKKGRGRQFKFTRFQRVLPCTADTILHYIVKVAKWVGPKVGQRIVEIYGSETLTVLKDSPERVAKEINGITLMRAEDIAKALKGNENEEQMALQMGELCGGIVPDHIVAAAVKRWDDPVGEIRTNPYALMRFPGCGFAIADRVAEKLGIVGEHPMRMGAAMRSILRSVAAQKGHTWIHEDEAQVELIRLTGVTDTSKAINAECVYNPLTERWHLLDNYEAESCIAGSILRLVSTKRELPPHTIDTAGWATDQQEALATLEKSQFSLLVGPPGTGKTWTLGQFVSALSTTAIRIRLAAPTGKAAKRMSEAMMDTGITACTIHRLLEPKAGPDGQMLFQRSSINPLEADVLIVDETSMLDVHLAAQLLMAVPDGCRVIFVGDDYQLPSVGAGAVLRDLLESKSIPTARLTEIKRNNGAIVRACHTLFKGRAPKPENRALDISTGHNWRHLESDDKDYIAGQVTALATEWAESKGYKRTEVMIVTPFNHKNKRELSCYDFNARVQRVVNPPVDDVSMAGDIRVGDRVVRLSNGVVTDQNEDQVTVVNGDLGVVKAIDKKYVTVAFEAPDRIAKMPRGEADLALAYSLTCHKMQGSEAKVIILPLHPSFGPFPCREWIYTAMSRAREILLTVGTISVIHQWAQRSVRRERQTWLAEMMGVR